MSVKPRESSIHFAKKQKREEVGSRRNCILIWKTDISLRLCIPNQASWIGPPAFFSIGHLCGDNYARNHHLKSHFNLNSSGFCLLRTESLHHEWPEINLRPVAQTNPLEPNKSNDLMVANIISVQSRKIFLIGPNAGYIDLTANIQTGTDRCLSISGTFYILAFSLESPVAVLAFDERPCREAW